MSGVLTVLRLTSSMSEKGSNFHKENFEKF